ncbi:Primase C terminal 2 (PriCT-2) [Roseivivax lentus]|uniref:Primase C terminal 2 (PriCT-2) n=1 Tax=Roseivivax lentus TaxID=633194 RepID=A0A1N7PIB5_9RHOB|nr:VapE domain-containing protein [Roseivivax lentus]SIT10331.1 Primase C terminal 2 (PriCT-2) [Roseivivax lentus]
MPEKGSTKAPKGQVSAALDHAEAGHPVLPWRWKDGHKVPHITDWPNKATTDPTQIRKWWKRWPEAQVGIVTGERSGIDVLDLDQKDGKDGVAALREAGHTVDSPVIIKTPTGGLHYWFEHVPGQRKVENLNGMEGVDVRADGGWAGVPGSDGYSYQTGDLQLWTALRDVAPPAWPLPVQRRRAVSVSTAEPSGLPFHVLRDALLSLPIEARQVHFGSDGEWFKIGRIIYDETGGSEDGNALWHEWSEGWGGYDYHEAQSKWCREDAYTGERATVWAILRPAIDDGWKHPGFDAWQAAEAAGDFDGPDAEEEEEIAALVRGPSKALAQVEWGTPLMRGDRPIPNLFNTVIYLGKNLDSILPGLSHNLMNGRDEWRDGQLNDAAVSLARMALERRGLDTVGKEMVADAAHVVARKRAHHPIQDQLNGLVWDGVARLDSWLVRHAGAEDTPYARTVGRKFLVAMVARVMKPGCKQDHTLVLSGRQGQNKSTACRVLAGAEYFSDTLPSIRGDKTDAIRHLQGKWLVELAELAPSRKSETEDLKAFLSGAVDRVRLPYAKFDEAFPRQCVFVGTTNEDQFLRDATGGRRFWPVAVTRVIDVDALAAERDQLFAEAVAAFKAGEPWWLDRDFEAEHAAPVQAAAYVSDSWAEDVSAWLDKPEDDFGGQITPRCEVTISEVLSGALGILTGRHTRADQMRAGAVLMELGWAKHHTRRGKVWRRPEQ